LRRLVQPVVDLHWLAASDRDGAHRPRPYRLERCATTDTRSVDPHGAGQWRPNTYVWIRSNLNCSINCCYAGVAVFQ
jgi:hypothetical protein